MGSSPYDAQRVATTSFYVEVARQQCQGLLRHHSEAPEHFLFLGDNAYCRRAFLYPLAVEKSTNVVVRLRNAQAPPPNEKGQRGRPPQYGARFALDDPTTWPDPDGKETWDHTLADGRQVHVHLKAWSNMRLRGTRQYPMYRCPFTLIQVTITTPDGRPRHQRPLWPAFFGPKRQTWAPQLIYEAYCQRFNQEYMHRFLTEHLLATAYATPDTDVEFVKNPVVLLAVKM